jgi:hypothetical protein
VFTILLADFLSDELPLRYTQDHIPYFRVAIGAAIIRGYLNYPVI